ncbi:phosphodiesterase [Zhengella mangrovi]|uniref:Phosphodiesterase n=1 Tax=Zhengella mangrovi TaxID=1982044 RepID=A0A2G1QNB0_9HYPH|nr:phosphodiesterase [Zhengella mangrovi]PHP66954.1 phosphodiesterase [Zhengella mangrovi]
MKLIHISDIHIHSGAICGLDPVENFRRCLADVEANHGDADRVVITGDLTHRGHADSYRLLADMLEASSLKGDAAPRLLIGNHDDRETFASVFAGTPRDDNGFIQWSEDTPAGVFIYMDTNEPGTHSGHVCQARRDWLEAQLTAAAEAGKGAWLFLHHNPIAVHIANADQIGIVQEKELQDLLAANRDTVRHIFFGHCHYTLSGTVRGIPYSAPRSTNHTCWPDFSGIATRMGYGELQPNYNVCFLEDHGTVIHSVDFLDAGKVLWQIEDEQGNPVSAA